MKNDIILRGMNYCRRIWRELRRPELCGSVSGKITLKTPDTDLPEEKRPKMTFDFDFKVALVAVLLAVFALDLIWDIFKRIVF